MMRQFPGYLITLEGGEGSGKTLLQDHILEHLTTLDLQVVGLREPGGTYIGDQIRAVLGRLDNVAMKKETEVLLFQASRAQLVGEVLKPLLSEGVVVVLDRFGDSTIAYQGYGHGIDTSLLHKLIRYATDGIRPDTTFLLDVEPEVGLNRKRMQNEWNRLDAYTPDFHERVRMGYLQMVVEDPERWVVIDANRGFEEIKSEVIQELDLRLLGAGFIEKPNRRTEIYF